MHSNSEKKDDVSEGSVSVSASGLASGLLSRRTFMASAALSVLAVSASPVFMRAALAAHDAQGDFARLSSFVTGRTTLNAVTGQRFFAALAKRDPAFGTKVDALLSFIDQQKLATMDAFLAVPNVDPALKATATEIVSAWYLGVVGDPASAELITYADSLMYEPTRGILAVPTYGPGPLAWGAKPESGAHAAGAVGTEPNPEPNPNPNTAPSTGTRAAKA